MKCLRLQKNLTLFVRVAIAFTVLSTQNPRRTIGYFVKRARIGSTGPARGSNPKGRSLNITSVIRVVIDI